MSNYGTQTTLKYTMPFVSKVSPSLSKKAQMRLKWMDYIDRNHSIPQCARHFDYPYRTVKYWRDRYNRYKLSSLEDRSKCPKQVRKSRISDEMKSLILEVRMYTLPGSGKVTIQKYLEKIEGVYVGQSRIQKVIEQAGLKREKKPRKLSVVRKNRKHMYTVPKRYLSIPGGLVYLDVKHLKFGREKWYQFTAIDHATRILGLKLFKRINSKSTVEFFNVLQEKFPFQKIHYVGTDNGSEFLGEFEDYLEELGVQHVFSSPSSPKQNPFVERVIRTVIEQQYKIYGLEDTPQLQETALQEYCVKYNNIRPHHSLNYLTPMEQYAKLILDDSRT